jgi:hypothetical protein
MKRFFFFWCAGGTQTRKLKSLLPVFLFLFRWLKIMRTQVSAVVIFAAQG